MTNKTNLELFKAAITEGLSNKYDSIVNEYTEAIECSERHKLAMRTIVYGKIDDSSDKKRAKLKSKHIIAIIVAAALLLLTSCGIIFRNQIREIFEDIFVRVNYGDKVNVGAVIEEKYELAYVPDGYDFKNELIDPLIVEYTYINEENDLIRFVQQPLNSTKHIIDSETGYSEILRIAECDVYYRLANGINTYIWNDEKYSLQLKTSTQLSNEEIALIIYGITAK